MDTLANIVNKYVKNGGKYEKDTCKYFFNDDFDDVIYDTIIL